jgi:hypothetical protein
MNAINATQEDTNSRNICDFVQRTFNGQLADVSTILTGLNSTIEQKATSVRALQAVVEVINAVIEHSGFIDDHVGREKKNHPLFLVYVKGDAMFLCPAYGVGGFCLNPIKVKSGTPHLSQWSLGGVVYPTHDTLVENCINYNNDRSGDYVDSILMVASLTEKGYEVVAL